MIEDVDSKFDVVDEDVDTMVVDVWLADLVVFVNELTFIEHLFSDSLCKFSLRKVALMRLRKLSFFHIVCFFFVFK